MNKQDRKELQKAIDLIEEAKTIIETIKDAEQEKYDTLSEGLQQTVNGQKFEENVGSLDDAFNSLEEAVDNLNTVIE